MTPGPTLHIWAQKYNRAVENIFALESELAATIVAQLHSKFSPEEKAAIAFQLTSDLAAFELYTQARDLLATSIVTAGEEKRLEAVQLLEQAQTRGRSHLTLGLSVTVRQCPQLYRVLTSIGGAGPHLSH